MSRARQPARPTEDEVEAVLARFPAADAERVRLFRRQLTEAGVTTEPLRTRMACEFADVSLAFRAGPGRAT